MAVVIQKYLFLIPFLPDPQQDAATLSRGCISPSLLLGIPRGAKAS